MDYGDPMLDGGAAYYPHEEAASFVFAPRAAPAGTVPAPIVYRGPGCDLPPRTRDPAAAGRWYPERDGPRLLAHEGSRPMAHEGGAAKREGFSSSPAGVQTWAPAVAASALGVVPAAPPADGAFPGQLGQLLPSRGPGAWVPGWALPGAAGGAAGGADPGAGREGFADPLAMTVQVLNLVLLLIFAVFAAAFGGALAARAFGGGVCASCAARGPAGLAA